ncbi:MAG: peptidoglycan-associated lipoprotein Pal [Deltaproteobacteria bacterium]|nr:MAG: peptidoglycan-associated lipoprotein Pal [Deltaproteobacteria bacterium]
MKTLSDKIPYLVIPAALLMLAGCPKRIPQEQIDQAEQAIRGLDRTTDCAPETTRAALATWENAQALLRQEKYEQARAALLAAKKLAEKAKAECERKKKQPESKAPLPKTEPEPQPAAKETVTDEGPQGLQRVFFAFDQFTLDEEAKKTLEQNAEYLRRHPGVRVQIEGHCDERGSTEYNLALGERRAQAVKEYLVKLGISPDRMEIISYGEENPLDPGTGEQAWARNRRAEFRELK